MENLNNQHQAQAMNNIIHAQVEPIIGCSNPHKDATHRITIITYDLIEHEKDDLLRGFKMPEGFGDYEVLSFDIWKSADKTQLKNKETPITLTYIIDVVRSNYSFSKLFLTRVYIDEQGNADKTDYIEKRKPYNPESITHRIEVNSSQLDVNYTSTDIMRMAGYNEENYFLISFIAHEGKLAALPGVVCTDQFKYYVDLIAK